MLAGELVAVAVGAVRGHRAEQVGDPRRLRKGVAETRREHHPTRATPVPSASTRVKRPVGRAPDLPDRDVAHLHGVVGREVVRAADPEVGRGACRRG